MTVRVGLVGCGFVGGLHSRALRALIRGGVVDARVVAVSDADPQRAAGFARAHGAAAVTDPDAVFASCDAVWLCTPTATHRSLVQDAAASGVAVYCEKPLAPSLEDARAMAGTVEAAGVANQVGLVLRASPALARLAEIAERHELGRPMAVQFRDDQYFPIQGQYASQWRADVAVAGGGTLLEHSIHDVDVLRWLLGDIVEVSARTANFAGHPGIEDVAAVTSVHASGATSVLLSVWHAILARPSTRHIELFCERGMVAVDDEDAGPLTVVAADDVSTALSARPSGPDLGPWDEQLVEGLEAAGAWAVPIALYARSDRAFLDAVSGGRAPFPGFDVALAAHAVADAAYRSAAAGGVPVRVELDAGRQSPA